MSARAAWRLETLGFQKVCIYKPGKADWLACGLPVEREPNGPPTLLDAASRDFPACRLNDSTQEAKERAGKLGFKICPVVNEQGIVLGMVSDNDWQSRPPTPVEQIMQAAPTTLRPNYSVHDATEFLRKRHLNAVLITTSYGKLMGIFERQETADPSQTATRETTA